jgi:hypothetical protein
VDKPAIAASELEDFAGTKFDAFVVFEHVVGHADSPTPQLQRRSMILTEFI